VKEKYKMPHDAWSVNKESTFEEVRSNVLLLLLGKDKTGATELIVKWIMRDNFIHTTRDDENAEMWIYKDGIYIPEAKTYIIEEIRQITGDTFTTQLANQVITKIQADTYIGQDEFFEQDLPDLIAVQNGILNLKTKELQIFSPDLKFFNKIPVEYNEAAKCPAILKFLSGTLANKEDIKIVEEIFGFLLYDDYFIEKAIMFFGGGRNGKGKTISLMKKFIGEENCTEIPLEAIEKESFAMQDLFKKKANLCGDLSKSSLRQTGNFKKLVGRDMITAARKFKSRVKFVNYAKMVFSANELPITYDVTDAFFNRWVIIDFPYQFLPQEEIEQLEEVPANVKLRDTHIIDKISNKKELSGLLNLALRGLKRLFINETFTSTETTAKIKEKWLMRSNSCIAFCLKHVEEDYNGVVNKRDFRKFYSLFCKNNKLKMSGDKLIKYNLETNYGASDKHSGTVGNLWEGIRLKNVEQIEPIRQRRQPFLDPIEK